MEDEHHADATDTKIVLGKSEEKSSKTLSESYDSEEYFMNLPQRGKCFIFNHKKFASHTKLKKRRGTDVDAARLYCRFKELGFYPDVFNDLSIREVKDKLNEAAKADHSSNSCFVCCILSHGDYGYICGNDGQYPIDDVFAPFLDDVCSTLAGKPKLFFIQACQGCEFDSGNKVVCKESFDSMTPHKIFTEPDFLIAYSTVPGFYSWRNTLNGSWFIQALCDTLEEHARNKDLLKVLTIVNRRVAFNFESSSLDFSKNRKKQVPFITSTLLKNVKF